MVQGTRFTLGRASLGGLLRLDKGSAAVLSQRHDRNKAEAKQAKRSRGASRMSVFRR